VRAPRPAPSINRPAWDQQERQIRPSFPVKRGPKKRGRSVALGLLLKAGGPVTAIDYVLDAVRELELLEQSRKSVGPDE
jgi:hypothetical protein